MLVSLKSWGRSSVVCTFVTVFLFLIVREEHSRPFAISFGLFASMLFAPQWITTCLVVEENCRFSARHSKFSTLLPHIPQFNVSFPKNGFHTYIYLGSPWIKSHQVILSVYFCSYLMLTYDVGGIYAIPVYKIVQRELKLVAVEVTFWQLAVIVLFMCPFNTALYGVQMFCHVFEVSIKDLMQWRWKRLWETLKIQIKKVRKKASAPGNDYTATH